MEDPFKDFPTEDASDDASEKEKDTPDEPVDPFANTELDD